MPAESRAGVYEMEAAGLPVTSVLRSPQVDDPPPCSPATAPACLGSQPPELYPVVPCPPPRSCGESPVTGSLCPLAFPVKRSLRGAGPSRARGTQGWFGSRQSAWGQLAPVGLPRTHPACPHCSCLFWVFLPRLRDGDVTNLCLSRGPRWLTEQGLRRLSKRALDHAHLGLFIVLCSWASVSPSVKGGP